MTKITELPDAGPITGLETLPIVQGGQTRQAPIGLVIGAAEEQANRAEAFAMTLQTNAAGGYYTSLAEGVADVAVAVGESFNIIADGQHLIGLKSGSDTGQIIGKYNTVDTSGALSIGTVCTRGSSAPVSAANKLALADLLAQAVTDNKAVLIPSGDWYIDGGIECLTGYVPLIVEGRVYTNVTGAFITMRTPATTGNIQNFYIRGGSFVNLNGTQAQKSSSIIKFQSAGALILYPEFQNVDGYGFYQMFDDDTGTYTTPFGEESRMNHGIVSGCVPHYYGALNAKYCFRRRTGSGTGWFYSHCRDDLAVGTSPAGSDPVGTELLGYPAYVRIESGGVNAVAGDVLIDGHFSGLQAGALSIDGACSYRSNISLTPSSQIDAQAKRAIFFDPAPTTPGINISISPINIGGNIDIAKDAFRVGGHKFEAQGFGQSTGGTYVEGIASGAQSLALCDVQIQADYSCTIELEVAGIVQGVAAGMRRKVFTIRHDGATVTATEQAAQGFTDPASTGAGFFNFTATVSGDTVSFAVTLTGTAANSKLTTQYRVTSGVALVRRTAA